MMIHRALHTACATLPGLQLPRVLPLIVDEARVVVAFVEILEDRGEDLGLFVRQRDALRRCFHELSAAGGLEEGRYAEDVFVGGEEPLFAADDEGYDGGG